MGQSQGKFSVPKRRRLTDSATTEIQSPLGAGGRGEVYRAADTKLGRGVALKVLPADMAQDPEQLGRFRREARAIGGSDYNRRAVGSVMVSSSSRR